MLPEEVIDTHCHGRDMLEAGKTTVKQVLLEAKKGGIEISFLMPNTLPPIMDENSLYEYLRITGQAQPPCQRPKSYLYFGLTTLNTHLLNDVLRGFERVVGIKMYPYVNGGIGTIYPHIAAKGMEAVARNKKVFAVHPRSHYYHEGNSVRVEVEGIHEILTIAETANVNVKILFCHVSTREGFEMILDARRRKMDVAVELTPHHLYFDEGSWRKSGDYSIFKCDPPLRSADNRDYLQQQLFESNIPIVIGSDNACHRYVEDKNVDDPRKAANGIPGNQEMVAVICTLAKRLGIPDEQVCRLLSWNAADFFSLNVSRKMNEYQLEKKTDEIQYNNGIVKNPWNGEKLLFPTRRLYD
jgi:dihydroorotase-like cyclic amidohydrolase